jgi:uncharacterized protein (DUF2147 family)
MAHLLAFASFDMAGPRCQEARDPTSCLPAQRPVAKGWRTFREEDCKNTTFPRLALAGALILAATAALAEPALGVWKTKPDDNGTYGHVQVLACGAAVCGTLVKAFDGSGTEIASPNIGKRIIWDMKPAGDGAYGDGKVWSPDRNKTYNAKMVLTGNGLAISGCVLGICRDGGTWSRLN